MAETRTVSSTGGEKGAKDARFDLIPPFVLRKLAEHYGRGAKKYADHNWRRGYKWSLSIAALHRHMNAFEDGEDFDICEGHEVDCAFVDKDGNAFEGIPGVECYNHTGSHHLDGVNFHGFALRYFAEYLPEFDDRYTTVTNKVESDATPSIKINLVQPKLDLDPTAIYKATHSLLQRQRIISGEDLKKNPKCGHAGCINSHD